MKDKAMPLVSICVTYYNQQEFVGQNLDSVLAIDFPCDFEILCGDDGSTDGTLDVIKKYAKQYPDRIKYFVMDRTNPEKKISRASSNRLNLASHALGSFIMFLDGDDYFCDTSFVKEAIEIFQKNMDIEACAFNFKYLLPDYSEKIFSQKLKEGILKPEYYIAKGNYTPAGACIFKNILDKERLETLSHINNFDDNAITIYMLQFGNLYYVDKPVYTYRQTVNSMWNLANQAEQHLLNAMDLKRISDSAEKFEKYLIKRLFSEIKYVYRNKRNLQKLLGKKYELYLERAKCNDDIFIANLLKWKKLGLIDKFRTIYAYHELKRNRR